VASALSARAFTIGTEVYVDRRLAPPGSVAGRSLLAHELTHVAQQDGRGRWIQRDPLPDDFMTYLRLSSMNDAALNQRHDDIVEILNKATQSTPENARLEREAGEIGAILARRAGRTFAPDDIARMRKYFEDNAKSAKPKSCIACLNDGMRLVLSDPKQKVASSVDETAAKLHASGHATGAREVGFNDSRGRPTSGTLSPVKLRESVWDAVVALSGGDEGWSVFVMSLMDGYHSVTLSLDNSDTAHKKIYWSDQWSTKGGFLEYKKETLDAEIEHLTHNWWEEEAAGTGESAQKTGRAVKMNTVVRIYRVLGTPHPVAGPAPPRPLFQLRAQPASP
jgi:hypothetical protein